MGGGNYSYLKSVSRSASYQTQSREEIFSRRTIDNEMLPKNKRIRESRDNEEHPESYPIILALDVTGSMGRIPEMLIKELLPEIMKKIMDAKVPNPQLCFCAIGDQYSDKAPIQVGEFESSDELMEHWLTKTYIEGGGGGDGSESYAFAWYFANYHTSVDSFEKRGKKGVLITIGDEANHGYLEKQRIKDLFGDDVEDKVNCEELLKETQEKWNVYHINYSKGFQGSRTKTRDYWNKTLGINYVNTESEDASDIMDIIPALVSQSYFNSVEVGE